MKKKKAGFTLLEMIIVVMLAVVVLGITTSVFITGNKVFSDSDVKSTLQMEGQTLHEEISKICMQGSDIEKVTLKGNPTPITGEPIKNITLSDVQEITINLRDYDVYGKLIKKPYTFTFLGTELKMIDNKNNPKLLSNKVKSFKFVPNNDIGGEFKVDLEYQRGSSALKKYSLDVEFIFRNKNAVSLD